MYNQVEVGTRLKELRLQKEYTQIEIADKLNVSRQAVSRWETGSACPDTDKLMLLGEIYGVSVDEVLGRKKDDTPKGESKENMLQKAGFNREGFSLIVALVMSLAASTVGLAVSIAVLVWLIREKKFYKIVIVVGVVCLLINIYNLYIFYGPSEDVICIEKID